MAINFTKERMAEVMGNYDRWWKGELDRPLMALLLYGGRPSAGKARAPQLSQASCADFRWSPEELIDKMDEELSTLEYVGDGYPQVNLNAFGPGVLAAFCGATLDNSSGRVWFSPDKEREIRDIHAVYDPENKWAKRIKDIYQIGRASCRERVLW